MNARAKLLAVSVVFTLALSTSGALSLALTNNDPEILSLELIENDNSDAIHTIEVPKGDTIDDLCLDGCTIRINGQEYVFSGYENLVYENGELTEADAQ